MIHIERNPVIPKAFVSEAIRNDIRKYRDFFSRSAKSRSQEGFNDIINGDTHGTLEAVAEQFKYKCATCEQPLTIQSVISDSWRPRQNAKGFNDEFAQDHYWWLAYVWDNKYSLCANCNRFKGTWFPVDGKRAPLKAPYKRVIKVEKPLLIDPCHDYPEEHFFVDTDGRLLPLTRKGEATIELLKLNRKVLVTRRKATISTVFSTLRSIEKIWKSGSFGNLTKLGRYYSSVFSWLGPHPVEEFVMVRRQIALTWLHSRPEYYTAEALRKLGSNSTAELTSLRKIFRGFRQILSKKPLIPLTFKPAAILKPDTDISEKILKKIITKIPKQTKKLRQVRKQYSTIPVTNLSHAIKEGLKVVSSLASSPFGQALKNQASSFLKEVIPNSDLVRLYPEKIEIKNFKSIAHLSFDFKVPVSEYKLLGMSLTSHKEPWKFLLGENGVGKSSILQAISLVLAGDSYIKTLELDPSDLLRHGTRIGTVKIWFAGSPDPAILTITKDKMNCNFETGKINVLGYGSTRVMPKKDTSLQPESYSAKVKIKNLFDYSVSLSDVNEWLLDIDQASFDKAARALKAVLDLPSVNTYFIRENCKIYFSENKETLEQLSEGYRSVISLAVDIMKTLSNEHSYTNSAKAAAMLTYDVMEGIVLIDEISSHLHPRWQMRIVKAFRTAFPKLQFIVTSHDPLSLKGIENGEVLLLKKDKDDNVLGVDNLPDPTQLRAEQLLTSEFFGLSSTLDPELELEFNTYHYLLAKKELTEDEMTQLNVLRESLKEKKHLGDSLREELMYNVIDSSLARYSQNVGSMDRKQLFDDTKTEVLNLWDKLYSK